MAEEKTWAKTYILDPLTEPEPSAAMGPGTSLATTNIPTAANPISAPMGQSTNSASRNDYNAPLADGPRPVTTAQIREASQREAHQNKDGTRHTVIEMSKNQPSVSVREQGINKSNNPFRQANSPGADTKHAASSHVRRVSRENAGPVYASPPRHHSEASHSQAGASHSGHRRQSSLTPRFPGDHSDHPLDVLREENREANHAPHLQKRHLPGADLIDRLDDSGFQYHHDGPFDAALLARNTSYQSSPVAALSTTNQEAINATPKEKIKEAVNLHRPMDGTAFVPPGYEDAQGRTMHYEEGEDMMIEHGGNFKRYDGIDYQKDDLEGRGEPAFSLGKDLHEHGHGEAHGEAIELVERPHGKAYDTRDPVEIAGGSQNYAALEEHRIHEARPASPAHHGFADGLKRRIGSLRGKKKD